jgi:hypothetical protein
MSRKLAPLSQTEDQFPPRPGYMLLPCEGAAHDEDSEEATCKLCAPRWGWVEEPCQVQGPLEPSEVTELEKNMGTHVPIQARTGLSWGNPPGWNRPPKTALAERVPRCPKTVRASKAQWEAYQRAADAEGRSLNAWILRMLDNAS